MLETSLTLEEIRFFMSLVEFGIIGGLILTFFGLLLNRRSIENRKKVDSAHFMLTHVDKVLEDCKETINTLHKRKNDESIKFKSDHNVLVLLDRLENIVYYITEGAIKKEYALIMLKITLQRLKEDKEVCRIIKDMQETYPTAYEEIVKFMKNEV